MSSFNFKKLKSENWGEEEGSESSQNPKMSLGGILVGEEIWTFFWGKQVLYEKSVTGKVSAGARHHRDVNAFNRSCACSEKAGQRGPME